jgi:hypothetical protein
MPKDEKLSESCKQSGHAASREQVSYTSPELKEKTNNQLGVKSDRNQTDRDAIYKPSPVS